MRIPVRMSGACVHHTERSPSDQEYQRQGISGWFRVQGSGCRIQGPGFRVCGSGFKAQGLGVGEGLGENGAKVRT